MTDPQRKQLDASEITYDLLEEDAYKSIWQTLEAFSDGVTKIEGSLNILHTLQQLQSGKTTGITADKKRLDQSMMKRTVIVANALHTYGTLKPDAGIVANSNLSIHKLEAIPDSEKDDRCQALYDLAIQVCTDDPAGAAKVGLHLGPDPADKFLGPLAASITAFTAAVHSPAKAIDKRADATEAIDAELHRMQGVYHDELDALIVQFEEDHPEFVAAYRRARAQDTAHTDAAKKTASGGGAPTETNPPGDGGNK